MSDIEENGTVAVLGSQFSRHETAMSRMEDAVNRTERAADTLTGADHIDYNGLNSMKGGKDQVLLNNDLCARPAHPIHGHDDEGYDEIIGLSQLNPEP